MLKKKTSNNDTNRTKGNKSKAVVKKRSVPSLISDDMNILGNLISDGYIDVNGHVEGNVKCHSLTIRESGMIKGDIIADIVEVHGQVNGIVKATQVFLSATARVRGVIMHESLSVDDGAYIDGQCKRTDRHSMHRTEEDENNSETSSGNETLDSNLELLENFRVISEQRTNS